MAATEFPINRRVLLVDDNLDIQRDLRLILAPASQASNAGQAEAIRFDVESTDTGEEAFESVRQSVANNTPYALAFVDIELGSGWNGFETIEHLWNVDPELQVVICSGYPGALWK
jgi:CheY-like chemotaxis protein